MWGVTLKQSSSLSIWQVLTITYMITVLGTRGSCAQRSCLQLKSQGIQERQEECKAVEAKENTGETGRSQMTRTLNGKRGRHGQSGVSER